MRARGRVRTSRSPRRGKTGCVPPTIRILHLSDTHAFGDDTRHYGRIDTAAQLTRVLAAVDPGERFDLVVVSGDVSEDGSVASYERVRAAVGGFASARGAVPVYAMGNHDRRGPFREVLGCGQPAAREPHADAPPLSDRPVVSVGEVAGLRVVVLDSSVPGRGYGELDEEQLAWLAGELAVPAPRGSVVVVHHPPIPARTDLLQALALQHPAALLDVLAGTDVRAVLSGHYHLPLVQIVRGVPVVVAPGVANIARSVAPRAEESATADAGATLVELDPEGIRVVPFTVPAASEDVFRFDDERVREIIAVAGPQ